MTTEIPPDGLHPVQYARGLLENVLAWPPVKTNIELLSDCLSSVSKAKAFSGPQAYRYLRRAILLAREQAVPIDRFFFLEGRYTEIRPEKPNAVTIVGVGGRPAIVLNPGEICETHGDAGRTQWGTCWSCYSNRCAGADRTTMQDFK